MVTGMGKGERDQVDGAGRFERDGAQLTLLGAWTLAHYAQLRARLRALPRLEQDQPVSLAGITELDTSGAALLVELLGAERAGRLAETDAQLAPERKALLLALSQAWEQTRRTPEPAQPGLQLWLAQLGRRVELSLLHVWQLTGFIGLVLLTLLRTLPHPGRWRVTALVHQVQQTGLDAVPIVALLTFLVGAVVAFLGATVLADFGASIYTVNLVAYAFLREFGVMLAAILLAGRTASAFTAQIGSMKANEELDALRTLGLDPVELLVLPRVLALLLTLTLLSFVAVIAGLSGGALVTLLALDIPMSQFMGILADIPVRHYLLGLAKAPVFAFLIAVIGCLEGFKVSGSAESVGQHTTSSVVQSIFAVILFDAAAAMLCMEMGW